MENLDYGSVTQEDVVRAALEQPDKFEVQPADPSADQLIRLKDWPTARTEQITTSGH